MMKTLTLSSSSDDNLRLLPSPTLKSTDIQKILGINDENDNGNANTSITPR